MLFFIITICIFIYSLTQDNFAGFTQSNLKLTDNNFLNLLVSHLDYYFFVMYCIWSRNNTENNTKQFSNLLAAFQTD